MMKRGPDTPSPVLVIDVDAIDEALGKIEREGGSVVRPRTEIPGMGAFAYSRIPTATFSVSSRRASPTSTGFDTSPLGYRGRR